MAFFPIAILHSDGDRCRVQGVVGSELLEEGRLDVSGGCDLTFRDGMEWAMIGERWYGIGSV
jgi:hypothetical protein